MAGLPYRLGTIGSLAYHDQSWLGGEHGGETFAHHCLVIGCVDPGEVAGVGWLEGRVASVRRRSQSATWPTGMRSRRKMATVAGEPVVLGVQETYIMPAWRAALADYDEEFGDRDPDEQPVMEVVVVTDGEADDWMKFEPVLEKATAKRVFVVAIVGHGAKHDATLNCLPGCRREEPGPGQVR